MSCDLAQQTFRVSEALVVHCGNDAETMAVTKDECWAEAGLVVRYFHYQERNCAQQRNFAVAHASYDNLLLVDDDVEVRPDWVTELFKPIWADSEVGATMGNLVNQPMATPTFFWRLYRTLIHGRIKGFEPGRLVGAALPNGFPETADLPLLASGFVEARVPCVVRHLNLLGVLQRSLRAVLQARIWISAIVSVVAGRSTMYRQLNVFTIRLRVGVKKRTVTNIFRCDRDLEFLPHDGENSRCSARAYRTLGPGPVFK